LSEAAELEHGIACSYLYAAFSLKRELSEGGMTWEEQQKVRRWAAQIYFVASQEMLHLALVWNLTTAIGGTPYYYRPNFPQPRYYPSDIPLELEPFGIHSLRRFIIYEHPVNVSPDRNLKEFLTFDGEEAEDIPFNAIGELYGLIESGFKNIPESELFIGSPTQQMTTDLVHFPDLVKVVDRKTAVQAIEEITEQGEGTQHDREDSHFGAFVSILTELLQAQKSGADFSPARPSIRNPSATNMKGYGAKSNPIDDPTSQQVAQLFDSVYGLMLRMLAWSFQYDADNVQTQLKKFCNVAIELMPRVLLPIGEGLTSMPAGPSHPNKTAGAGFGLKRHVMLPPDWENATRLVRERLKELVGGANDLLTLQVPESVKSGCRHLVEIGSSF
jgi:hypothetical protein